MVENITKPFPFRLNSVGVNPSDVPTIIELLNDYYTRIVQCVEVTNESKTFLDWLKEQGLKEETLKIFDVWITDGTFDRIINEKLFSDLNNKIDLKKNIEIVSELPEIQKENTIYFVTETVTSTGAMILKKVNE